MKEIELDVEYNDELIEAMSASQKPAEGWRRFLVTDVTPQDSKPKGDDNPGGLKMLKISLQALEDPDDPDTAGGFPINHFLCLPILNGELKEDPNYIARFLKAAGAFRRGTESVFRACLGEEEIPARPYKDESGQWFFAGEEVEDKHEAERMLSKIVVAKSLEMYASGGAELKSCAPYARIIYEKDKNGAESDFPSLKGFCAELPEGEALTSGVQTPAPAPAKKAAPAPAKKVAAPAKKKR